MQDIDNKQNKTQPHASNGKVCLKPMRFSRELPREKHGQTKDYNQKMMCRLPLNSPFLQCSNGSTPRLQCS